MKDCWIEKQMSGLELSLDQLEGHWWHLQCQKWQCTVPGVGNSADLGANQFNCIQVYTPVHI